MNLLSFCLHSLRREYGWQFCRRIAVRHPIQTARALFHCICTDELHELVRTPGKEPRIGGRGSIVAVGFCLKPLDPPCPSGRASHDCLFLERSPACGMGPTPSCDACVIRKIGTLALLSGAAFYIMTSAKDILRDVFVPSLEEERFTDGLFVLCPYSFQPFALGLLASGLRGRLLPLEHGDCRDYRTWLRADRGLKPERTQVSETNWQGIREILDNETVALDSIPQCRKRDNVLFPCLDSKICE